MSDQEIRRYEQMLADDPKSRAFAPLAEAYRKAGRFDDAIKVAETGLRYHPDYSGGLVVLGRTLFEKDELARASEVINKAVREAPDNYMAQKILAKVSMALGEDGSALKALEAASILSPGDMEVEEALEKLHGKISHPGGIDFVPETESEASPGGSDATNTEVPSTGASEGDQLPPLAEGIGVDGEDENRMVPDLFDGGLTELSTDIGDLEEPPDLSRAAGEGADPGPEQVPPFVSDLSSLSEGNSSDAFISDQAVEEAVSEVEEVMDAIMPSTEEIVPRPMEVIPEVKPREPGLTGDEDISTETLADLYAQQGLKEKAAQIYNVHLKDRPDDPVLKEKLRKVNLVEADGTNVPAAAPDGSSAPEVPDLSVPESDLEPLDAAGVNNSGGAPVQTDAGEDSPVAEVSRDPVPDRQPNPLDVLEVWLKNAERMRQR